jgi:hypothetical protein
MSESVASASQSASEASVDAAYAEGLQAGLDWNTALTAAQLNRGAGQAALLRHIVGNPFRTYPAPARWPDVIVALASALYGGQECSFALHDVLLEAGHDDLAAHFEHRGHPRGCWVLDLILGKQ